MVLLHIDVTCGIAISTFIKCNDYHCSPLPILSLSGVDRHDCLSPCFSILFKDQSGVVSYRSTLSLGLPRGLFPPTFIVAMLISHLQHSCRANVGSSHHMVIPRKVFLCDTCGDWLDHCIVPVLFISDSAFPWFAPSPS